MCLEPSPDEGRVRCHAPAVNFHVVLIFQRRFFGVEELPFLSRSWCTTPSSVGCGLARDKLWHCVDCSFGVKLTHYLCHADER